MFKEGQAWLVTMLDLVLIIACFFVLSYVTRVNKLQHETPVFGDGALTSTRLTSATSLDIIYNSLLSNNPSNVEFHEQEQIVRILPEFNFQDETEMQKGAQILSTNIYNFAKNPIKVMLLLDYSKYTAKVYDVGGEVQISLKKLIEQVLIFRNLLAKNSNNDKISSGIDVHSSYTASKGKDALIVIEISGPN